LIAHRKRPEFALGVFHNAENNEEQSIYRRRRPAINPSGAIARSDAGAGTTEMLHWSKMNPTGWVEEQRVCWIPFFDEVPASACNHIVQHGLCEQP
tara:strand:- start:169 stop:456 length:288 start_codon:yes stop_codon:yes gene_type:complete